MTTFVLLSKVSSEGVSRMRALREMDKEFGERLQQECPGVKRVASYILLGAYDFMHVFEAPDAKSAAKVAILANSFGVTTTQTLTAIPFEEFTSSVGPKF